MNWDFSTIRDKNKASSIKDQLDGKDYTTLSDGDTVYAGNKYIYKEDVYLAKETHEVFEDNGELFFDVSKFDLITKSANIAILVQTGIGVDFQEGNPISTNEFGNYETSRIGASLEHFGIVHKVLSSAAIQVALEGVISPYGDWASNLIGSVFYIDENGEYTTTNTGLLAFKRLGNQLFLGSQQPSLQNVSLGEFQPNTISLTTNGRYAEFTPQSNVNLNIISATEGIKQKVRINLSGQSIVVPNNSVILNSSFEDSVPPPSGAYNLEIGYNGSEYEFELIRVTTKSVSVDKTTLLHFIVIGQSQAQATDSTPKLGHNSDPNVLMLGPTPTVAHTLTENQIKALTLQTCQETVGIVDTISVAFGRQLLALINNPLFKVCVTICAIGGRGISALTKGGEGAYEAALYSAERVKSLSDQNDWNYEVHHIWMHGGHAGTDYQNELTQHISDFRTDFGAITTQTRPIWVFMDQIRQRNNFNIEPSHLMVKVMESVSNVLITHPRYVIDYRPQGDIPEHLTSNGQRQTACFFALGAYRKLFNIGEYHSLNIDSIQWDAVDRKLIVNFNNINNLFGSGNYGFRLYNLTEEESLPIDNINLVGDRVEITPDISELSVGNYNVQLETMFRDDDTVWEWYPDFDLDTELGFLYEQDSFTPIFVDTNTDQPYRMDRFLLRTRNSIQIEIVATGENQAPTASNLSITGKNPVTGDFEVTRTLGCEYTYSDFENDPEGNSIIRWYIADDNQGTNEQNVTADTLLLTSSHLNKYIDVGVTPVAQTGELQGSEVRLGYTTAVTELAPLDLNGEKIYIHLDRYNSDETTEGTFYNGVSVHSGALSGIPQEVRSDIKTESNTPTGLKMYVSKPAWNAGTFTLHTDESNFAYPFNIVRNYTAQNSGYPNEAEFYIHGNLNNQKTYKLTIYGYVNRDDGQEPIVDIRVQGVSKNLNLYRNLSNTVVFDGVEVDEDGRIYVQFARAEGTSIYVAINLVIIEESDIEPGTNQPPAANNVRYSGGILRVGDTITALFDYVDPEGDAQGSHQYNFYIADDDQGTNETAVQESTSDEFTFLEAHEGKYFDIGVIPVAATGASPGTEMRRGYEGPIAEESAIDTPSQFLKRVKDSPEDQMGLGYWEYLPVNFNPNNQYPVFVGLYGYGETGTGSSSDLNKLTNAFIGQWILNNKAHADEILGESVVILPQSGHGAFPAAYQSLLANFVRNCPYIDPNRRYVMGLSGGGYGIRSMLHDGNHDGLWAAVVVIAASWASAISSACDAEAKAIPKWFFGAEGDTTTNAPKSMIDYVNASNACTPPPPILAKYTIFQSGGHDNSVWGGVVNLNRIGSTVSRGVPYLQNVWDWCKQYSLGEIPIPQLSTPGSFSASSASSTSLSLTWTDPNDNPNEVNFEINYRVQGTSEWTQKIVAQDATSDTLGGLANSTTYECRVRALGDDENSLDSPWSSTVTATTGQQAQLATPTGFGATSGDTKNTLSWNVVPNAETYELEFHNGDSNWAAVPGYNGTDISGIEHTGLTNDTEYFYRVRALASGYISSNYATDSATPVVAGPLRVLIDIGHTANQTTTFQGNTWNNVHSDNTNKNFSDPHGPINLVDTQGNASGISWEQTQAGDNDFGAPNNGGVNDAGTNQDIEDYPASACNDSAFTYTGATAIWVLSGFDSQKDYDVDFWGARAASAPRTIEIADNPGFTNSQTYEAANNTNYANRASFRVTGVTSATFYLRSAGGGSFGYVSVMDIKEVV